MNHSEPDDLLKEVFADEGLESLRENSLGRGLTALRARRRHRALRQGVLMAVPVLALAAGLYWQETRVVTAPPAVASVAATTTRPLIKIYPAVAVSDAPPVPTISDEELLALFPDRSVGLIGASGHQQLVFFDQPGARH